MRIHMLLLIAFSLVAAAAIAAPLAPIPLWKGTPPGDKGGLGEEKDMTTAKDNLIAGKPVIRLGNVSNPTVTFYPAPKAKATGAAVVVFPGGGYHILAMDLEGTEVCDWLNSIGVSCALLKYRVPAREGQPPYAAPLQDAQRAVGIVRSRAKEWGLDPKRIGVLGFSAGAHLAAVLSNDYEKRTYDTVDQADQASCRPDFVVMIYPGGLVEIGERRNGFGPDLHPNAGTPPTIIVQTEDDPVHVENALTYYTALKAAKVPVEMHLYPAGGHGYGLRPSKLTVTTWPDRVKDWMHSLGVI